MGKVIAVLSGKGGVGKTTVAACLACALAEQGQKVLAVDCDFGFRNLDLLIGLENEFAYDIGDALSGVEPNRCIVKRKGPTPYFLPSTVRDAEDISQSAFEALIARLKQNCDTIVLDAGAGLGKSFSCCVAAADLCLVVTTPDATALRDAEKVAGILSRKEKSARLIINRVRPKHIRARYIQDMDSIVDYVGIRLAGLLPEDEKLVVLQSQKKNPLGETRSDFARAFESMVKKLEGKQGRLYRFW